MDQEATSSSQEIFQEHLTTWWSISLSRPLRLTEDHFAPYIWKQAQIKLFFHLHSTRQWRLSWLLRNTQHNLEGAGPNTTFHRCVHTRARTHTHTSTPYYPQNLQVICGLSGAILLRDASNISLNSEHVIFVNKLDSCSKEKRKNKEKKKIKADVGLDCTQNENF